MDKSKRQAAKSAFREQKTEAGIFVVTCAPTGRQWVGKSRNLSVVGNRLSFSLKMDPLINAQLRADYQAHGEESLTLAMLEVIDEETPTYFVMSHLKARMDYWRNELGAMAY